MNSYYVCPTFPINTSALPPVLNNDKVIYCNVIQSLVGPLPMVLK